MIRSERIGLRKPKSVPGITQAKINSNLLKRLMVSPKVDPLNIKISSSLQLSHLTGHLFILPPPLRVRSTVRLAIYNAPTSNQQFDHTRLDVTTPISGTLYSPPREMPYTQHVYGHLRPLALILFLASFLVVEGTLFPRQNEQREKDLAVSAIGRRLFYAIVHRVLTI